MKKAVISILFIFLCSIVVNATIEDNRINSYSLEELEILIEDLEQRQYLAHQIAEQARQLDWGEDCATINAAKEEWHQAEELLTLYCDRYIELYEQQWSMKHKEYPVASYIWDYMENLGWNQYVCAGILGNVMTETGGNTLDVKYNIYGKGYYGICQWNKAYSEVWGQDLLAQCDFLKQTIEYEINTYGYLYQKDFNYSHFLNLQNEQEAALAFATCYERCSSKSYEKRKQNAITAYQYYGLGGV